MADQNQRISDLLDALTDASSEEIETALRIFEPADVAAVVAERALAGGGGGGGSSSAVQTFSLTAQQIKDSTLTPHTIIPAQGAGTFVVPTMYVFDFLANTTPFSGGPLELVYGDLNLNALHLTVFADGFDYVGFSFHALSSGWAEGGSRTDYLNKPLRFRANLRGAITQIATTGFATGSGYAVGDTGTVDDGSTLATYIVTAEDAGVPTAVTITSGGDGYNLVTGGSPTEWTSTPGGAQPGSGSGMTIYVAEVDASASVGDGTLSGLVYYEVATLT